MMRILMQQLHNSKCHLIVLHNQFLDIIRNTQRNLFKTILINLMKIFHIFFRNFYQNYSKKFSYSILPSFYNINIIHTSLMNYRSLANDDSINLKYSFLTNSPFLLLFFSILIHIEY